VLIGGALWKPLRCEVMFVETADYSSRWRGLVGLMELLRPWAYDVDCIGQRESRGTSLVWPMRSTFTIAHKKSFRQEGSKAS